MLPQRRFLAVCLRAKKLIPIMIAYSSHREKGIGYITCRLVRTAIYNQNSACGVMLSLLKLREYKYGVQVIGHHTILSSIRKSLKEANMYVDVEST